MKHTIWVINKVIRFCFKYIFGLIFILLFSSFIRIGLNILNKNMMNELVNGIINQKLSLYFYIFLFLYFTIWLLTSFMTYLRAFSNNLFRLKVDVFMQKIFMYRSIKIKQERFFDTDFMDTYSFICDNTNKASTFIFKMINILFSNVAVIISAIVIFSKYEPLLVIYCLIILAVQGIKTIIISNKRYKLSVKQINEKRVNEYLSGIFTNKATAKEMRIFNFIDFIFGKWEANNKKYLDENLKMNIKQTNYNNLSYIINFLIRIAAIFILLFGVRMGKYDLGTFVMLFGLSETCNSDIKLLSNNIFSGIFSESKYFKDYYEMVAPISNKQIKKILQYEYKPNFEELKYGNFDTLELKNVSFVYPNANIKAVNNVNFKLRKGEIVSILGYNGSGKTTLSKIMYGAFTPTEGSVKLNGTEINESNKEHIFKYFGFGPQEYAKYSLSIRDYVSLGCIEKMNDNNEVEMAYKKANMKKLINKYSTGDCTILGKEYDSKGVDLSGGEMQKVVIGSAYMGSPEILILDEPTASIDPLKEIELLKNFRNVLKDKTAILISHRIGFARLADRIIMMKNGEIVEEGTHQQLLQKDGYYAEMFYKQKQLYE